MKVSKHIHLLIVGISILVRVPYRGCVSNEFSTLSNISAVSLKPFVIHVSLATTTNRRWYALLTYHLLLYNFRRERQVRSQFILFLYGVSVCYACCH
ncbi:hypothetical protein M758_2G000700 [Ceratodon purpureus]|nr:hypothetical protein M758_2G000700 [Ceratodon purpureus]